MNIVLLLAMLLLAGCVTQQSAPVIDRTTQQKQTNKKTTISNQDSSKQKDWRPDRYTVKQGDTLYSIGLEFGYDYKEIAIANNINPPYPIQAGQVLNLKDIGTSDTTEKISEKTVVATPIKTETIISKPIDGTPIAKPIDASPVVEAGDASAVDTVTEKPETPSQISGPVIKTEPIALKMPYSEQAMTSPLQKPEPKIESTKPIKIPTPAEVEEQAVVEKTKDNAVGKISDKPEPIAENDGIKWMWPTQGSASSQFNETAGSKGVDIPGKQDQPVRAAAAGKVVYSGSGLRGYGKLVIIKHNKTYLSAYAHNSNILVKEGQTVMLGQPIAKMGKTDADKIKLHFEIRKLGKPVDPEKYLPNKP